MSINRTEVAAQILPALIASINAPGQVSKENRTRVIKSALVWAHEFLEAAGEMDAAEMSEGIDAFLKSTS